MQTIIIATDFSESALNAANYAAALAKPFGVGRIVLYHSYDNVPIAANIPVTEVDASMAHEHSLRALEEKATELRHVLDSKVVVELVANGLPVVLGVEQLAEQRDAGLVVAGTTGKGGLEQVLVGSNAINLASEIKVPLLIVPKDARYKPIDKIVFACDLKRISRATPVSEIGNWLQRLNAKLLVLNVAQEGKRFDLETIPGQYKMHDLLDVFSPEYHYTESDDIADEIEDFAEDHNAGLIVTIPKSSSFFEGLFRRSVSKRLIKDSDTPLLLLREREV